MRRSDWWRTSFSLLVPALETQGAGASPWRGATAAAIAGRTLVGWLMPANADRRLVALLSYAVQIVGSLVLFAAAGANVPLLILGVLLFGSGIGNGTSLPPLIAQVEFVKDDVARVVPLIVATSQGTFAFAPRRVRAHSRVRAAFWYGVSARRRPRPFSRGRANSGPGDRSIPHWPAMSVVMLEKTPISAA